jgi:hypothetical protein
VGGLVGEREREKLGGGVEGAAKGVDVDDGGVWGRREWRCWRRDVREGGEMFILGVVGWLFYCVEG